MRAPPLGEVPVEQLAHRHADPRRHVDAVGDIADGDLVELAVGPQRAPHLTRDLAVTPADGIGGAAHPQRRLGDPERRRRIGAGVMAERHQLVDGRPELADQPSDDRLDLIARVRVVAGGDRRMRGEDGPGPRALHRVGE